MNKPEKKYPEAVASIKIFNHKGELLLVKSGKWKGVWVVPGGHVELNEKIEDAVKREAKEETGLEVTDLKFVRFKEVINAPEFSRKCHLIGFVYTCKCVDENVVLNNELVEFKWVTLDEALSMNLLSSLREDIEIIKNR